MFKYTSALPAALAALGFTVACSTTLADDVEEFSVFDVFAELNHSDGDLGFHFALDGGPWTFVALQAPNDHLLWTNRLFGRLRRQGGTEIFFESAEPPFESDEGEPTLTPEQFFARFQEGEYKAMGRAQEGGSLTSTDQFTHVMPAPPENITIDGLPAADSCDDDLPEVEVGDLEISWDEVDESHPTVGTPGEDIEVALYEVVAEVELEGDDGEELVSVYRVEINPPDETSMTIPESFVALAEGEELKFEVLVKEAEGGNQTAVESCADVLEGD